MLNFYFAEDGFLTLCHEVYTNVRIDGVSVL